MNDQDHQSKVLRQENTGVCTSGLYIICVLEPLSFVMGPYNPPKPDEIDLMHPDSDFNL